MKLTQELWEERIKLQDACRHSVFGSCLSPCPKCETYGFFGAYNDGGRKYCVCKWCGYGINFEGEYQCYLEICDKCYPDEKRESFKTSREIANSSEKGIRFTQFPGHLCPKHKVKMEVWNKDFNPFEQHKKDLYEIHMY